MKTVFNIENYKVMKNYMKYICAILLLLGTSASAWATTITLKVWDSTNEVYVTWGTFEKGNEPGYGPTDGGWYYNVAWAPGEQEQSHSNYSKNFPTNGGTDNGSTWFNQYAFPTSDYNGEATTLYAVYDDGYNYTTRPYMTFADLAGCSTSPTVTAGSNSSVASTSATVSCSSGISALGDCGITSYGFVYGTSSNPTTSNSTAQVGTSYTSTGASFSKSLTGLSANTTYYVRPYATNGGGTGYGTQTSFTTLAQYTISYNANGGDGSVSSQTVDAGGSVTVKDGSGFSKTGYSLSGWKLDNASSGTAYSAGDTYSSIGANHTFYAQWTANDYTITLNNQGADDGYEGTDEISVTYGDDNNLDGEPAITVPTKTGYTFGGYYTETGGNGGQVIAANGNVIAEANDGVSEYFTDEDKKWIYANGLTLYAKWTANTISLTLDKNCASGTDGSATITFDGDAVNSSPTHATNSDATYSLAGYYSENTCAAANKVLDATGNVVNATVSGYITSGVWTRATTPTTLYAKWSKDVYKVDFDMQGHGDAIDDQEVESGAKVIEPEAPTEEDYRFKGWYKEDTYTNKWDFDVNTVSAATTLYAKWEEVTYSETLKAWCDPDIEITGDIYLTSTNGIAVYTTSTTSNLLGISSDDLAGVTKLEIKYLDADNGNAEVANASSLFRLCSSSDYSVADGTQIDVSAANTCDLSYSIRYTPSAHNVINHYKLQITMKRGTRAVKTVTKDLYGRSLPEEFVIAAKNNNDNQWYALPNTIVDNNNAISPTRITVDNTTTPTKAEYAPNTTVYKGAGRYASGTNVYGIGFTTDGTDQFKIRKNSNYVYLSTTGSSKYQDFYLASTNGATFGAYNITVPSDDSDVSGKELGIYGNNFGYFKDATVDAIYILPIENKLTDNDAIVTEWGKMSVILDVDAQSASSAQARLGAGDPEKVVAFGQTRTSAGSATKYNYTLRFSTLDFSTHKGELLYIDWLDEGDNVLSTSAMTIPWIIASSGTMSTIDGTKDHWKDQEVHVLPGATLTADGSSFGSSTVVVKQLEIYPGATVKVTTGTLSATNLIMRNGWTRAGSKEYDVARLYIADEATLSNPTTAYADWYIDFDQYYPVAVPWEVDLGSNDGSKITYKNTKSKAIIGSTTSVRLRYYDGASRATSGQTGVGAGANWKLYGAAGCTAIPAKLVPGKGYAMTAKRPTGKAFSIIRMPMTIPSATWTTNGEKGYVESTHKDQVGITAHGVSDDSKPRYTVGWNFIANPYMALYSTKITHSESSTYDVTYVNIPDIDFKEYGQYDLALDYKLLPASGFFIQAGETGTLTFGTTNRRASAPTYRAEGNTPVVEEQKAYIVLNNDKSEDVMGLKISENYTADYEINADLEKLLGDGTSLKTYMHYGDMNMAYVAINQLLAQEWIPVSVRIPKAGEFTFSLHEASIVGELEGVYLIDYANENKVTNLIDQNYTFVAEAGTINGRFAINAIVGERETPTAIDVVGMDKDSKEPIKFLWHDKVFILHRGVIYDSTGKKVR